MKIYVELELEPQFYEDTDGVTHLESLRFPGCTQNLMPFMSVSEIEAAQQETESRVQQAAIAKVQRLLEQKEIEGDIRREAARDERLGR